MRPSYDHDYPPAAWTAGGLAAALADPDPFALPTYDDAGVFERLRTDDATAPVVTDLLERAADAREEPVPPLPASLYLDYHRTGERYNYQPPNRTRRRRLGRFALAECIEREGDYLDPVLDYGWAICEQSAWVIPAHLRGDQNREGLPGAVPDGERTVALRSAETAHLLAEVDHLLGDRLHPALRERIRHEVDRRVFTPYEARDHRWMEPPCNNWNAVCNGAIGVAALHLLDDPDRQGRLLARAVHSLEDYLADFDPDGCTAEGIGYWNYGFGHYAMLAAALDARTGGEYSLLSPPIVHEIAQYPLKVELSPDHFVPFSDADEHDTVRPYVAAWLGERLDLPALTSRGRRALAEHGATGGVGTGKDLRERLRNLLWTGSASSTATPEPPRRQFFDGYDWWLVRADPADPDGLVVVAKGGHNGESHNHNDLGSFVVHYQGESLLTDLGSPTYDRDYFSEQRYDYLVARSLGHSVPYVNGCEQAAGADRSATVVAPDGERQSFTVDVAGGYPEAAGLEALRRTVAVEAGTVTVTDRAAFERPNNEFESVLVSYLPMTTDDEAVIVTGERARATVTPDRDVPVDVERLPEAVRGRDVWRARLGPITGDDAVELGLGIVPEPLA